MKRIFLFMMAVFFFFSLSCNKDKIKNDADKITDKIEDKWTESIKEIKSNSDKDFIYEFSQEEMYEIELAKLSIKHGESKELKNFTLKLIRDHEVINQNLIALSREEGFDLPDTLEIIPRSKLIELEELKGDNFDKKLLNKIIITHEKDIKKLETKRERTENKNLIEWIDKTLPHLNEHLQEAKILQTEIEKQ